MSEQHDKDWDQVWQDLLDYAPSMSQQGKEYLDLIKRLMLANQILMQVPDLEDEAFREIQSMSVLLRSVGDPEEEWLLQLMSLITHLTDMLYVRTEYLKWEVSPLSALPQAIHQLHRQESLTAYDRELLDFLKEYDRVVRSGRGLGDPEARKPLLQRAAFLDDKLGYTPANRQIRAIVHLVHKLLLYYPEEDSIE